MLLLPSGSGQDLVTTVVSSTTLCCVLQHLKIPGVGVLSPRAIHGAATQLAIFRFISAR